MAKSEHEHVFIDTRTGRVKCRHCGASYNHNGMLPAPFDFVTRVMEMFLKDHKKCKPPVHVAGEENTDEND